MKIVGVTDHVLPPYTIEQEALGSEYRIVPLELDRQVADELESVDAMLVWHSLINREIVAKAKKCKIIVRYGVGYENLDLSACSDRHILCCNTPDYGTEEVADTAVAMILNLTRKISEYDFNARFFERGWQEHVIPSIKRSNTMVVGIIGVGRIGGAIINRLKPFGFELLGYDPYLPSGHEKSLGYQRVHALAELLAKSDIITMNCNQTSETKGMINHRFIDQMKPGAYLVNTARGPIIENLDVIEYGLQKLSGIALDVLPSEPPDYNHSVINKWRDLNNRQICGRLIINPHSAFYSQQAWYEMRYKAAETIKLFFGQGIVRNRLNSQLLS